MPERFKKNILMIGNFPPSTGYAWDTIREYFLSLGQMFVNNGNRAIICYPEVDEVPDRIVSAGIEILSFDFSTSGPGELYRFIRKHRIGTLYLTDRPVYSFKYLWCRLAGVKNIVIHDRTSGDGDTPGVLKKCAKTLLNRYPIISADLAIAISEFVKQRLIRVSCFPEQRTVKIWNGIDIEKFEPGKDDFVFEKYHIPKSKKIIFANARANKYKGIQILIEAANILVNENKREDLFFLYCGDGPDLDCFHKLIGEKNLGEYFLCPGKTSEIDRILKGVSIVVVPSLWQEGFGLSVIEGMAAGKVVIASKVGGIPEIISDSENGYLVSPGDSKALATKIADIIDDEDLQNKIGDSGRKNVINRFNIEEKKEELLQVFRNFEKREV